MLLAIQQQRISKQGCCRVLPPLLQQRLLPAMQGCTGCCSHTCAAGLKLLFDVSSRISHAPTHMCEAKYAGCTGHSVAYALQFCSCCVLNIFAKLLRHAPTQMCEASSDWRAVSLRPKRGGAGFLGRRFTLTLVFSPLT